MTQQATTKQTMKYLTYLIIGLFIVPLTLKKLLSSNQQTNQQELVIARPPLPKPQPLAPTEAEPVWLSMTAKKGDTLSHLFKRLNLSNKTLHQWLAQSQHSAILKQLSPGQRLSYIEDKSNQFKQLRLALSETTYLEVVHQDNQFKEKVVTLALNKERLSQSFTIHNSLLGAAIKAKLPTEVIYQLITVFKQKVDFSRDIKEGDQLSVVYETQSLGDKVIDYGPVLAAKITLKKKAFEAIHYSYGKKSGYYMPNGQSFALGFDRYPVKFSHIGSVFNLHRYHPILHITRAHRGIDLAASLGTPIKAVADGIVEHIGPLGGFGNMVKLKHSGKFETVYGHMLRFKHGLKKGSKVLRGTVIGYVGQTGLATAPHCHFEFHVNGRAVNPATVKLPTASSVANSERVKFQEQTEHMRTLLDTVHEQA